MNGTNEYLLITQTSIGNVAELVRQVTELFFLRMASSPATHDLQIEVQEHGGCIIIKLSSLEKLLQMRELSIVDLGKGELVRRFKVELFTMLETIYRDKQAAWGILRGVRPVKLAQRLMRDGFTDKQAVKCLQRDYLVSLHKAELVVEIAVYQNVFLENYSANKDAAVYVGVPYCNSKCSYCSFPSSLLPGNDLDTELFLQTIEQDARNVLELARNNGLHIVSLYVGGGTPTSFREKHFLKFIEILGALVEEFPLQEFTFEAGRVDSLSVAKIEMLRQIGVTRVSLNPQTFSDKTLETIGRGHTVADFYRWYEYIRSNCNWTVNMDIILGLPGEKNAEIIHTLAAVSRLKPDNFTVHTLAFKRSAELFTEIRRFYGVNENISYMLKLAEDTAKSLNMSPYYLYRQGYTLGNLENVGYTMPGQASIYNIMIMCEGYNILGVGPSATTKLVKDDSLETLFMPKDVTTYVNKIKDTVRKRTQMLEKIIAERK